MNTNNNEYNYLNYYKNKNSQEKIPPIILEYIDDIKHYQILTSLNINNKVRLQLNNHKKKNIKLNILIFRITLKKNEINIDNSLNIESLKKT